MQAVNNVSFILFALVVFTGADMHGQGFLGKRPEMYAAFIRSELTGVLGEALGDGHGVSKEHLSYIKSALLPIFESLPKNGRGRVSEPIMKYTIRRYFSATHAWIVKGFEEHPGVEDASNSAGNILQSRVPGFVRSTLEQRFQQEGFALDDMVSMIAVVESLAFNELVRGVEASFHLNSYDTGARLSHVDVHQVMASYMIIEILGEATTDKEQHTQDKKEIHESYPNWHETEEFMADIIASDAFGRHSLLNPFVAKTSTFEDTVRMAGRISEEFGPWSSYECHDMKAVLSNKDVHETGRVKLTDFYKASFDGAWHFTEPAEHLRQLGALDESSSHLGPQVIIPNYINGLSNCITSAPYFSICCLNECDQIHEHIEGEIVSSNGTVSQILQALETSPAFPDASDQMISKLKEIAVINGGSIPIHGRLFAQWLHFALPRDCPYPHAAGSITPKSLGQWRDEFGEELESVTKEEIVEHFAQPHAKREPSPDAGQGMWNLHEALMEVSTPSDEQDATWARALRLGSQLAIVAAFGSVLVREGMKTFSSSSGKAKQYTI